MGEQTEDARASRGPRTPRGRVVLGAAAGALALVGAVLVAVQVTAGDPAPDDRTDAGAMTARVDGAIAPRDGWRWIERGSVAVQVPEEWAEVSLTCGSAWDGGAPAVANVMLGAYAVVADCARVLDPSDVVADPVTKEAFPPVASSLWRTLLIVEDVETVHDDDRPSDVDVPDGIYTYAGWTLHRTTYDQVRVTLLHDEEHADVASLVLSSLTEGDLSPSGCRPIEDFGQQRHQALAPGDVVRAGTVCGYTSYPRPRGESRVHGLLASRRLDTDGASTLVAGLSSAPTLPADPEPCAYRDDLAYVQLVRLFLTDGGVRELEVPVVDCAVQFDGGWRVLTDDAARYLVDVPR
ncbi:hypothetical protein [Nocardioides zeae]|uniref:Uncharacterized protein n=1 Tax=Nocardioides zeae TaxID=1457234 RepID=A0A6P0HPT2_9ACTN|nr:hypothetical protein [Nocardioides zeae]NEN80320.1 hypothetical protein [Nocardioides zeae]